MPDKLTDTEIKKALECCVGDPYTCGQCPYQEIKHYDYDNEMFEIMPNGIQYDQWSCDRWLLIDLLDLINRKEEENKSLKAEVERLKEDIKILRVSVEQAPLIRKDGKSPLSLLTAEIKTEAYKEFAERLKEKCRVIGAPLINNRIDNLLKELVGDDSDG